MNLDESKIVIMKSHMFAYMYQHGVPCTPAAEGAAACVTSKFERLGNIKNAKLLIIDITYMSYLCLCH